jgi:hypothetical protein
MVPKLAAKPSKGHELYEARDLRIVPVDSPDPEVRTHPSGFARLEIRFYSGEQATASPYAENRMRAGSHSLTTYYTQYAHFVKSSAPLQRRNSSGTLGSLLT